MNTPQFSVIIPLEFHRNQLQKCLTAWTGQQGYPRELYELVVVAPEGIDPRLLAEVQPMLRAQDRLIYDSSRHDMGLSVVGAGAAKGEILFFTESHCWPEPDTLERARNTLEAHPDWAGFSARSVRCTHSRFSELEADMYEADIEYGMLHLPWRKILDQCFVVRRKAYEKSGGFKAVYGHFAEWLLSARFFEQQLQVGYDPEVKVHHYYIGSYSELAEFTDDFIRGLARYHSEQGGSAKSRLFPEVPYVDQPGDWMRSSALHMLWLCLQRPKYLPARIPAVLSWITIAVAGRQAARMSSRLELWLRRLRLSISMICSDKEHRRAAMRAYWDALVKRTGANLLSPTPRPSLPGRQAAGEILFGDSLPVPAAGFYLREEVQEQSYRWSAPEAFIELPLLPGPCRIQLQWKFIRPLDRMQPTFYWNGRRISGDDLLLQQDSVSLKIDVKEHQPTRLGWTCRPIVTREDRRRLGLLMERLSWNSEARSD